MKLKLKLQHFTLLFVNVLIVVYSTFQSTLQNNIAAQGVLTKYNYRKYSMP